MLLAFWTELSLIMVLMLVMMWLGMLVMAVRCWHKVAQGTAVIITGAAKPTVHFSKAIIIPMVRQMEVMDITVKRIEVAQCGPDSLALKDNDRADLAISFFLRVNATEEDVLAVAQAIGVERASNQQALEEIFRGRFADAARAVAAKFTFAQLDAGRESFVAQVAEAVGADLYGFTLDRIVVESLHPCS